MERNVDLVITYVNNKDEKWKKDFVDYCISTNQRQKIVRMVSERYSGTNWLPYQLKLVKKFMPFVRKVFLVVSSLSQIKGIELTDNVVVVEHREFIPNYKLPTFNSTTIELYLPKIKELGEYFIYANDDMLPLRELKESDFFIEGKIRVNWFTEKFDGEMSQFKHHCFNNFMLLKSIPSNHNKTFKQQVVLGTYMKPEHTMIPFIKSHCLECFDECEKVINSTTTTFRNDNNLNQYLYCDYEWCKYYTRDSELDFYYTEFEKDFDFNHDIICVNVERNIERVIWFKKELDKLCE